MDDRSWPVWHAHGAEPADVALDGAGPTPSAAAQLATADVLVVGLGATGLTAMVELASAGASVVGVDVAGVGAGAAGANGGFLLGGLASFHHDAVGRHGRDVAAEWYARTIDELSRIHEEEPTARQVGSLRSASDEEEAADLREHHDALRRDGVAVEMTDGPLGPALLLPDDGVVDPMARCRRLAAAARNAGAAFVTGRRLHVDGGTARLDDEPVDARAVLVCVDGGLEATVPALRDEVTSVRLQMLATAAQPERLLDRPLYHRWGHDYAQQLPSGELAVGGGRDLDDGARRDPVRTTPTVQQHLETFVAALGGTGAITHRWAASSAYTADRLPIDREVAAGIHVLGGYSGHGNVLGVMLARAAAARVLERLARPRDTSQAAAARSASRRGRTVASATPPSTTGAANQ